MTAHEAVTTWISTDAADWLRREAEADHRSVSYMIRTLVEQAYEKRGAA